LVFATSFDGRENMPYSWQNVLRKPSQNVRFINTSYVKLKTKDIQAIKALMHAGELPVQDIADRFGVSRATLYRNAACPESPKALKTDAIQDRAS
jgi:hypothetical protein